MNTRGQLIAEGRLDAGGALAHPIVAARLRPGTYEIAFEIGAYLDMGEDSFLDVAAVRFRLTEPEEHCRLPLKFTAFGYAPFRRC